MDISASGVVVTTFVLCLIAIVACFIYEELTSKSWGNATERSFFLVFGIMALSTIFFMIFN